MIGELGLTGWWPKEQVTDPHDRSLKPWALLLQLLEFGDQLIHNLHEKGVIGWAPKHRVHGRRHHHLKFGKLPSHFSMAEGRMPHPLRQMMPCPWGTNDGVAHLRARGLQKGEPLKLLSLLPLRHLSDLTLHQKLALKEGGILMSRG
jgi:hypothetical protein